MIHIIMGKRFGAPPTPEEILNLLTGERGGDINQAKQALTEILAPMPNLVALLKFTDDLVNLATRQAALLKEQEQVEGELENTKGQLTGAQKALKNQTPQIDQVNQDLAALETTKKSLSKEIEDENSKRLMLDQTVKAEYERLRKDMLGRLKLEEELAGGDLKALKAEIAAAETILAQTKKGMAELAKGLTE